MPARDASETSARDAIVPPCLICGGRVNVRRLIGRMAAKDTAYWTCDDCLVAWVDDKIHDPHSTAAARGRLRFW
jgi:hypothetical protein